MPLLRAARRWPPLLGARGWARAPGPVRPVWSSLTPVPRCPLALPGFAVGAFAYWPLSSHPSPRRPRRVVACVGNVYIVSAALFFPGHFFCQLSLLPFIKWKTTQVIACSGLVTLIYSLPKGGTTKSIKWAS